MYLNALIIDIIFILFFIFMIIYGYIKGFIVRTFDFIMTILVFFLSYWLSSPLSSIFQIYQYDKNDFIASVVGGTINRLLLFLILLIVLYVIKKIIIMITSPQLKKLCDKFSLTQLTDHVLGIAISLIEGVIIAYMVILLLITPFYPEGKNMINDTLIAKHILDIVPSITEKVQNLNFSFNQSDYQEQSLESLIKMALTAQKTGILSDEQVQKIFEDQVYPDLKDKQIVLSKENKNKVKEYLSQSQLTVQQQKLILSKINESDEK